MEQYIIREGLEINDIPLPKEKLKGWPIGIIKSDDSDNLRTVRARVMVYEEALGIEVKRRYDWGAKQLAGAKLTRKAHESP